MAQVNVASATTHQVLVIFHLVTAGKQGPDSGSDEYPIVLLTAKLVHLQDPKLHSPEFQTTVRPSKQPDAIQGPQSCAHSVVTDNSVSAIDGEQAAETSGAPRAMEESVAVCDSCSTNTLVKLTDECKLLTGLTDEALSDSGSLENAIRQFDQWIREHVSLRQCTHSRIAKDQGTIVDSGASTDHCEPSDPAHIDQPPSEINLLLVTDGPLTLRLLFHPEVTNKSIDLTPMPYFYRYVDLHKVFSRLYTTTNPGVDNIVDMLKYFGLPYPWYLHEFCDNTWKTDVNLSDVQAVEEVNSNSMDLGSEFAFQNLAKESISEASEKTVDSKSFLENNDEALASSALVMQADSKPAHPGSWQLEYCRCMASLIERMTYDGADWTECEHIYASYKPAIVRKTDLVEDDLVVRARGLPWQATDLDIFRFFSGINISEGGISLVLSKIGRRNGEALIRFTDREQRDLALRKHKHHMGQRYIEIYAASGSDFIAFAGGETEEAEQFLRKFTSPFQALIRMRGLPYTATTEQIIQFFANANCPVQFGEEGVLFVNRHDGRATGDAFVIFESQATAEEALKSHRQHIGNRYIELFKSTPAEVNQVMNSAMNPTGPVPNSWSGFSLDRELVLNTAANMSAGPQVDFSSIASSNEFVGINSGPNTSTEVLSQLAFTMPHQALNMNFHLLHPNSTFHPFPRPGKVLMTPCYQPSSFGSIPVSTFDQVLYPSGNTLSAFNSIQPNNALFAMDSSTNNLNSLGYPVPLTDFSAPSNVTQTTPIASTPFACDHSNQFTQSGTDGLTLPMNQLAKFFIHIKGMPPDTDILDILAFLEDNWRNVTLHGVHRVYNVLGQPTGEAIIQFVSEHVAQMVAKQKNGALFVHHGTHVNSTALVEVRQCTSEDLKQLLLTILTMLRNGSSIFDNSLIPASQTVLNGPSPLVPFSVSGIPMTNSTSIVHGSRIDNVDRMANSSFPVRMTLQGSFLADHSPSLASASPTGLATTTMSIPLMTPHYPATTFTQSMITGSEEVSTLRAAPVLASNLQSAFSCGSIFPTMVDLPSTMMLRGILPSIPPSLMSSTTPGAISFGAPLPSGGTRNSTGYHDVNSLCASLSSYENHLEPNKLTITPPIKMDHFDEESKIHKYETRSVDEGKKSDSKRQLDANNSDPVVVHLKGLPKDVTLHEIAGLFGEKSFNLKLSSIKMDYTNDRTPSGNASILFQSQADADCVIQAVDSVLLRGHRVQVRLARKR
ncbi:RNA-binding protein fusilli [Fasciola hepatica]|uniref:RNA-binding protein fusilli n=1 Tax=Fasciola hepatica TaxID=6192 RepID=A0A4E0S4C7_FASHE|nr:RNA-binding protein fusilli [Fasciola hepatica]